jgi:hypothetical protein
MCITVAGIDFEDDHAPAQSLISWVFADSLKEILSALQSLVVAKP